MPVVIKRSVMVDQGQGNTDQRILEEGPVCVNLANGNRLCWGPNESKVLSENDASEVLAAESRLTEVSRS